jgi:hypothetical protein
MEDCVPCECIAPATRINPPKESANMLVTTAILQEKVEGLMRNLTSEDVEARDAGINIENVATMRGGAPAVESIGHEGLQVGLLFLKVIS